jgi:tetraacyldisaccharide 4'-kinase
MAALESWLLKQWYEREQAAWYLRPFAALYGACIGIRRWCYRLGMLKSHKLEVPVVVVGNLTAGGTGKTPTVLAITKALRARGYRVGIMTRGYRGATKTAMRVAPDTDPALVGDEAVLLARRSACPVAIGSKRVEAARVLKRAHDVDVLIADDGLQHLALHRDFEVLVLHGTRRFGNGALLPAGPLRERRSLASFDAVVLNGGSPEGARNEYLLTTSIRDAIHVGSQEQCTLASLKGRAMVATAGIADPARFFQALRAHGLEFVELARGDHHAFDQHDAKLLRGYQVCLCTEKDAVKLERLGLSNLWVVPLEASLPSALIEHMAHAIAGFQLRKVNPLAKRSLGQE